VSFSLLSLSNYSFAPPDSYLGKVRKNCYEISYHVRACSVRVRVWMALYAFSLVNRETLREVRKQRIFSVESVYPRGSLDG
jgi:hypothetical protein